jgi:putative ABC transport system ATP-binding protein
MSVESGEFVAIRGRSGSGKSTLLNILGLLERPDYGEYALRGRAVASLSESACAELRNREIGFVFQLPALLTRATARENVELPLIYAGATRRERRHRAESALDRVGLCDRICHYPNQLSGGEQQRVAIARALVNDPALILADEPTGALDSVTSDQILSLFQDLHRDGRTIIIVTHGAEVARRVERQITLHDGKIIKDDAAPNEGPKPDDLILSEKL